jgi:PBSX family phage terminase large subunit
MSVTALQQLRHRYIPRGVQEELFYCTAPAVVLSGPAGTGKSRACLEKVHQNAISYPGSRHLFVRKAREWLTSTALVTFNRDVIAADKRAGNVRWWGGRGDQSAMYEYANGSTITIGGMKDEAQAGKVMSSEYDSIYVQEATQLDQDDWEDLSTRCRNGIMPYQQLLADCNPQHQQHWLKLLCDEGRAIMLETRHEENPFLFDDFGKLTEIGRDYIERLDNLTGVKYLRLRKGQWASREGVIFEDWNPNVHWIEPFEPPDDWARYWSVDFGHTHPFVWQNWVEDNDGRGYLYQEIYRTGRIVEDHCEEIKRLTNHQFAPQTIYADHDAEDRATLERHLGMPTRAATKTVLDGIEAMQVRLRKRRMFIMRNSVREKDQSLVDARKPWCTAMEIPGYIWHERKTQPGITTLREGPVKDQDDGCDAARYYVAGRDLRGVPNVRFIGGR